MQITDRTAFGLLVVHELIHSDDPVTNAELAERVGATPSYMVKVMRALIAAKLVTGVRGRGAGSGYTLRNGKVRSLPIAEIVARLDNGIIPVVKGQSEPMRRVRRLLGAAVIDGLVKLRIEDLFGAGD